MEEQEKTNKKLFILTAIKIMLFCVGGALLILIVGAAVAMLTNSTGIILLTMMSIFVGIVCLLAFIYPICFKGYKKYYDNKMLEEENAKKENSESTAQAE